ncbi:hypothetical protein BJX68DRAFT_246470 [Aspergillus pseudodeflectus]|uniref:Uncharacterized protein n=1 Tax=Aspergillus pseudodeflectus TaxID=176178 RepID=A0ABR4JMC6_9EURO
MGFKTFITKCHFNYQVAKANRDRNARPSYYNGDRNVAEQWIPRWTKEENLGIAILQRLQHLSHLENKVSEAENKNGNGDQDLKTIQRETKELRDSLINHHRRLEELLNDKPVHGKWIRAFDLERQNRDPVHGRPAIWWNDRRKCAELGVCCGSLCGCCEKPLRAYLDPENRMMVGVYGHCTSECGCCICSRRCYLAAKSLPNTTLGKYAWS